MTTMLFLLTVIVILLAPLYIVYKPPAALIRYFQHRWPDVLWHVPTSSKVIALTIDDAPSEYTREILQLLKANDATATFFIIGSQVTDRKEILQDLVRSGNELGNHAMYDEPSRSLSDAVLAGQIEAVEGKLQEVYTATGVEGPPRYFRPGSGFFSARMRKVVNELESRMVLGGIYPHDPNIHIPSINSRHILSMLQPGGIIICHDRRSWTVPMLKEVLPEMRRRGYRVVTVSGLLKEAKG